MEGSLVMFHRKKQKATAAAAAAAAATNTSSRNIDMPWFPVLVRNKSNNNNNNHHHNHHQPPAIRDIRQKTQQQPLAATPKRRKSWTQPSVNSNMDDVSEVTVDTDIRDRRGGLTSSPSVQSAPVVSHPPVYEQQMVDLKVELAHIKADQDMTDWACQKLKKQKEKTEHENKQLKQALREMERKFYLMSVESTSSNPRSNGKQQYKTILEVNDEERTSASDNATKTKRDEPRAKRRFSTGGTPLDSDPHSSSSLETKSTVACSDTVVSSLHELRNSRRISQDSSMRFVSQAHLDNSMALLSVDLPQMGDDHHQPHEVMEDIPLDWSVQKFSPVSSREEEEQPQQQQEEEAKLPQTQPEEETTHDSVLLDDTAILNSRWSWQQFC